MDFADVVRARRMVRRFRPEMQVPPDTLARLLRHARRGPSAGNSQGTDLVVLHSQPARDAFWAATTDPGQSTRWLEGMRTAPVLVVLLSDPQRYLERYAEPDKGWTDRDPTRWPVPWWDVDTGMAALLLLLGAVDEGLGACLFGVPAARQQSLLTTLRVPEGRRPVGVVALGYPAPDHRSASLDRGRRPAAEVVHDGAFGVPWVAPEASD